MQRNIPPSVFMNELEARCDIVYTEEQTKMIQLFGEGPAFCFAYPGTGKTFTAIGGLIWAEIIKGIPGDNIYALSFTRLATDEMAVRYEKMCKSLGMSRTINFRTLHSLCWKILSDNYNLLGMSKFEKSGKLTMADSFGLVDRSCREKGIQLEPNRIRAVIRACTTLNSSLIFDKKTVCTKMAFKQAHVDYETFEMIRGLLLSYNLLTNRISVNDLLLFTVLLLQLHPEISEEYKQKCKLMLVDEAQDLSLLQLRIISLLTDNAILIGDMKQQIYGFNGACQEVAQRFFEFYPNAVSTKLTQSFRCKNEIMEYATRIIKPNNIGGEDFKGTGSGGIVCQDVDNAWHYNTVEIVNNIRNEFLENARRFVRSYMFLTRSNISLTGIVERLYQAEVPFRMNLFTPAYEIPVIKELCEILKLCDQPYDARNCMALKYLIPEFKRYKEFKEHPYYIIAKNQGCSLFEINYQFEDPRSASIAFDTLQDVVTTLDEGRSVKDMFNRIYSLYYSVWLESRVWMLENKPTYYINSVQELTGKTYDKFIMDEVEKEKINAECNKYGRGVRCYTMHASKGLEADVVYIIDACNGIIPNAKKIDEMIKYGCEVDAARSIREERSLCYVACTRAKEELYIVTDGQEISPIMLGKSDYSDLDFFYNHNINIGDDVTAFVDFSKRYLYAYIKQ